MFLQNVGNHLQDYISSTSQKLNDVVKWLTLLLHILESTGLNLSLGASYPG
jgi:hypothetical protein